MRSRSARGRLLSWLPQVVLLTSLGTAMSGAPAAAQSLFEALFGPSKPSRPSPQAQPGRAPLPPANRAHAMPRAAAASYSAAGRDHTDGDGSGRYRTVCVRLCDGYYWPISHNVSRARVNRDANACRSGCGEEARLFYMPARTSDIDDAVDLQGRLYSKIPNAFVYRKRLINGCACRPAPWSDLETARHNQYLIAELASRPRSADTDDAPPLGPRFSARSAQDIESLPATMADADTALAAARDVAEAPAPADAPRVVTPPLVERPAAITLAEADPAIPETQPPRRARSLKKDAAQVQAQLINRKTASTRAPVQTAQAAAAKPPVAPGIFSSLGGPPKYTWPGDPVRR